MVGLQMDWRTDARAFNETSRPVATNAECFVFYENMPVALCRSDQCAWSVPADATVAAAAVLQAIQAVVSRMSDPVCPLVITVGSFHSGTTWNIISDKAELNGTCRSFDSEVYDRLPDLLERVTTEVPKAYGCTGELKMVRKTPPLINDPAVFEIARASAAKVLGEDRVLPAKQEMIGEDFACFEQFAPVCFVHLGGGADYPLHSSHVIFQEEAMKAGMAAEVQFALDALNDLNSKTR